MNKLQHASQQQLATCLLKDKPTKGKYLSDRFNVNGEALPAEPSGIGWNRYAVTTTEVVSKMGILKDRCVNELCGTGVLLHKRFIVEIFWKIDFFLDNVFPPVYGDMILFGSFQFDRKILEQSLSNFKLKTPLSGKSYCFVSLIRDVKSFWKSKTSVLLCIPTNCFRVLM